MPRLRQHSCLQAYALGDLAKYANPGEGLSPRFVFILKLNARGHSKGPSLAFFHVSFHGGVKKVL
jgi:hypothetical protein